MTLLLTPRMAPGLPAISALPQPIRRSSGVIRIGRADDADIVLVDPTSTVSARHCAIALTPAGWAIADTSTNGTLINGARASRQQALHHGDVLRIGPYELLVELSPETTADPADTAFDDWRRGSLPDRSRPVEPSAVTAPPAPAPAHAESGRGAAAALLAGAGLARDAVAANEAAVLEAAGAMLRQAVTGTIAALSVRAKARRELGVAAAPAAANPIRSAPSPEQALARLLAAPAPAACAALAEAQAEIEAHQRAALVAMQSALLAAMDEFAPAAIRARTGGNPAAAWKAYEAAFDARDGFIEVFATELGKAYTRELGQDDAAPPPS